MRRWFYLVVALQLVLLLAQVGTTELAIRRGTTVLLKAEPVDPRSLFMGDYLDLRYEVSRLDLSKLPHDAALEHAKYDQTVYVTLKPGEPYATPVRVSASRPRDGSLPYLRGHTDSELDSRRLFVRYGLERYYFPEARQDEVMERTSWRQDRQPQIGVEVVVTGGGRGLIKRVIVDGKPLDF